MIKLDGRQYAVKADGHKEVNTRPVRVANTLAGKTVVVNGAGQPRRWRFVLIVPDTGRTARPYEGYMTDLQATYAKRVPPANILEFWDERTAKNGTATCNVVIANPEIEWSNIGQVLADAKYEVPVELVEVLT